MIVFLAPFISRKMFFKKTFCKISGVWGLENEWSKENIFQLMKNTLLKLGKMISSPSFSRPLSIRYCSETSARDQIPLVQQDLSLSISYSAKHLSLSVHRHFAASLPPLFSLKLTGFVYIQMMA